MSDQEKILEVINTFRPYINGDGGDIEFLKYEDDYVYVKVYGACVGCGSIDLTISDVLYHAILDEVPTVKGVINVDL